MSSRDHCQNGFRISVEWIVFVLLWLIVVSSMQDFIVKSIWTIESTTMTIRLNLQHKIINILSFRPQLQSLAIWINGFRSLTTMYNILQRCPSISKLRIDLITGHGSFPVNTGELNSMAFGLPALVDVALPIYWLSADDVIVFIRRLNLLKKLYFILEDHTKLSYLKEQLNSEWQVLDSCFDSNISITLFRRDQNWWRNRRILKKESLNSTFSFRFFFFLITKHELILI